MRFSGLWTSEECVVQPTRLPLTQEITGAKPVRDASFNGPQSIFSDALHWYWRFSSVQFRVRAPDWHHRSRATAQVGFISSLFPGSTGDCDHFIDASLNSRYADVAETDSVTSV